MLVIFYLSPYSVDYRCVVFCLRIQSANSGCLQSFGLASLLLLTHPHAKFLSVGRSSYQPDRQFVMSAVTNQMGANVVC